MAYIWNSEQIENLLQHWSEDVREWAVHRALELYPDILAEKVISLIPSSDDKTTRLILTLVDDLDLPITINSDNSDILVAVARGRDDPWLRAMAGAILLRSGYELLPAEIESDSIAICTSTVSQTERGFERTLKVYSQSDSDSKSILEGIAEACNFSDIYRNLSQAKDPGALKKTIDFLRQLLRCDIPHLERLNQPQEILTAMDQAFAKTFPVDTLSWKQGLLTELEHDQTRLKAIREIAGERTPRMSPEEKKFLLAGILCLWRNAVCCGRLVEAGDIAGLWRALTTKPWRGIPGQELKNFLFSVKPDELVNSLSEALSQEYSYAAYSFGLLNVMQISERLDLFLDVYEGKKYNENLAEEAGEALRVAGTAAADFIIEKYSHLSESLRILILFVLDSFPIPLVVDFCLKHFEDYLCGRSPNEFVGFLEQIGSAEFLAPLLQEWKAGEVQIGGAIKLLSEIHNIKNEQIDRIIQDYEKGKRTPEKALDTPITLYPLRCSECGHTYNYKLKRICIGDKGSSTITDIIQCKGCGSLATSEMTTETHFKITAEVVRVTAILKDHPEKDEDSLETPLKFIKKIQMLAGHNANSVSEAYRILQNELKEHPEDAILHRRMGNFLKNGGRPDLAFPYYQEAVRLNSHEAESLFSIVDILIRQERYHEAIPYVDRLVPALRESQMDESLRKKMFRALVEQTNIIKDETGHNVELFPLVKPEVIKKSDESAVLDLVELDLSQPEDFKFLYRTFRDDKATRPAKADLVIDSLSHDEETHRSPVVKGKKIGRNDPCPCGSGKKYKKCCGR